MGPLEPPKLGIMEVTRRPSRWHSGSPPIFRYTGDASPQIIPTAGTHAARRVRQRQIDRSGPPAWPRRPVGLVPEHFPGLHNPRRGFQEIINIICVNGICFGPRRWVNSCGCNPLRPSATMMRSIICYRSYERSPSRCLPPLS